MASVSYHQYPIRWYLSRQREGRSHYSSTAILYMTVGEPAKAEPCTVLYDQCRTSRRNHSSNLYAETSLQPDSGPVVLQGRD